MASTLLLIPALMAQAAQPPGPAVYTNEEQRYFAQESGKAEVPQWLGIETAPGRGWRKVDAFGKPLGEWAQGQPPSGVMTPEGRMIVATAPGRTTELRRGQRWTCWVSMLRAKPKADGSADWSFASGLPIHDQGGRALASDADAPGAVIRLRQVIWPLPSRNKPSLVLYVHRPDEPDRSVSYSWADPQARLIGINLRWMQGSCSKDEARP